MEDGFRSLKQLFGIEKSESFQNLLGVLQDYNFVKVSALNQSHKFVRSELRQSDLRNYLGSVEAFKNILEDEMD